MTAAAGKPATVKVMGRKPKRGSKPSEAQFACIFRAAQLHCRVVAGPLAPGFQILGGCSPFQKRNRESDPWSAAGISHAGQSRPVPILSGRKINSARS